MQGKKRQYDLEVENLEKKQKQTIERLEQDHTNRLRDEAKRIKADQDKELAKFQNMLKNRKKEVRSQNRLLAPWAGSLGGVQDNAWWCFYRSELEPCCHIGPCFLVVAWFTGLLAGADVHLIM